MTADPSPSNLQARVLQLVAETQQIDVAEIRLDSTFEELGIDSFDGLNLLFAVENEFGVRVSDEQARELKSVRDIVDGIRRLRGEAATSGA